MHTICSSRNRKIAALCVVIVCLLEDENEEGIRKKRQDRVWMKRRKEKGAYESIFRELAAEDSPTFKNCMRMDVDSFRSLVKITSPRIAKTSTKMRSPKTPTERLALSFPWLVPPLRSPPFWFELEFTQT